MTVNTVSTIITDDICVLGLVADSEYRVRVFAGTSAGFPDSADNCLPDDKEGWATFTTDKSPVTGRLSVIYYYYYLKTLNEIDVKRSHRWFCISQIKR